MRNYYGSPSNYYSQYWTRGVRLIILANIAVFILQIISAHTPKAWRLDLYLTDYFALWPAKVVRHFYIWQLLTSTFMHNLDTLFHLLFNMLALFFFGHMLEDRYGTRRFLIFYCSCAIFASLFATCVHFALNDNAVIIGASGAIMGVLVAAACLSPNSLVYLYFLIPVRLKTLIWILIAFDIFAALPMHGRSSVAVSAHFGGMLFGYLYYKFSGRWYHYFERLEQKIMQEYQKEQKKKYRNTREEVDRLLDKINQEGISALSQKEKDFLQKASKQYQDEEL